MTTKTCTFDETIIRNAFNKNGVSLAMKPNKKAKSALIISEGITYKITKNLNVSRVRKTT